MRVILDVLWGNRARLSCSLRVFYIVVGSSFEVACPSTPSTTFFLVGEIYIFRRELNTPNSGRLAPMEDEALLN